MLKQRAIIIGGGPAGLTAAYELALRTSIQPIVLEKSSYLGGISRTVRYKGNRMDIGGHRFFSKSDRVMTWWLAQLPMAEEDAAGQRDEVMLLRSRKSRIYFLRRFFDYPLQLNAATLARLGLVRTVRIGLSYVKSSMFPIRPVNNLEQFFINRFGRELYLTFFKSYTEKVWGVPCEQISAEWGAQRIKGLSIRKALAHFLRQTMNSKGSDYKQKSTETSLIEQFLYPKFGPGQMWEHVAGKIAALGGEVRMETSVIAINVENGRVRSIVTRDKQGNQQMIEGDYFFSTMPVQDLVRGLRTHGVQTEVPPEVREISDGLMYRDFVTVGLLLKKLKVRDDPRSRQLIKDNWIYIQEPDVLAGRLQIFNNWSPYMVADPEKVWVGVEYFCYEGDELWCKSDEEMARLAVEELDRIDIIDKADVLDFTVARMEKTYPAYFGTYERFDRVRQYLDGFENLFLIGRNGMHKYNNQDHSMLTAMVAVDNIIAGVKDKTNIWAVNTEEEYHETK